MDRRPIASRDAAWVQRAARRLSAGQITPNQISIASIGAAAIAGGAFWVAGSPGPLAQGVFLVVAAVFCQIRLLCNLLDGMVAIEGGKRAATGPFWNEFPDRVADILILAGAGLGAGHPALGFAAACMAVATAYVRELGRASGAPSDFRGPMAKPHRMAVMTGAALLEIAAPYLSWPADAVIVAGLWIVTAGAILTVLRRAAALLQWLNAH